MIFPSNRVRIMVATKPVDFRIRLAYCWAHARRKLIEITRNANAPIAEDGVKRIGDLYRIEAEVQRNGKPKSTPITGDFGAYSTISRLP
jgi:hypothetical protein